MIILRKGPRFLGASSKALSRRARTVQGLGYPGFLDFPVKITGMNEVTVVFGGYDTSVLSQSTHRNIDGSIDRVTSDVEASSMVSNAKTNSIVTSTTYSLTCRPAQRMF
jgi:hypothetical protein